MTGRLWTPRETPPPAKAPQTSRPISMRRAVTSSPGLAGLTTTVAADNATLGNTSVIPASCEGPENCNPTSPDQLAPIIAGARGENVMILAYFGQQRLVLPRSKSGLAAVSGGFYRKVHPRPQARKPDLSPLQASIYSLVKPSEYVLQTLIPFVESGNE